MAELDATLGGSAANSYLSLDEADDLMELSLQSDAWENLQEDNEDLSGMKAKLLAAGTKRIDQYSTWGEPAIVGQRLAFPSLLFCDKTTPLIPDEVKRALIAFVEFMLEDELVGLKKLQGEGVRSASILQQNASFDPDLSGLPAESRRELENLLQKIPPRVTNHTPDGMTDPQSFFG